MRKILNFLVLFAFLSQQIAWATHLPWLPDFESSSVLPYHIGDKRLWVLLSKKTYEEEEYKAPAWGDFGGKVENKDIGNAARAAARELEEESEGQITTTEAELLSGPFHQMDMNKSPFGEGVRRHTIFFKRMDSMPELKVAEGIDKGPTRDGKCEVSKYQWVLANDLLKMDVPALFGDLLGLYTPDALRVISIYEEEKKEFFSVPFFVLLQQTEVRSLLLRSLLTNEWAHSIHAQKTFSQIVFTGVGFQDWRLVHSGYLSYASAIPAIIPAIPDDLDELPIINRLAIRAEISNATGPKRTLEQVLAFDPEARQVHEVPATMPVVQLRLLHKPRDDRQVLYPFAPDSPNYWALDSLKTVGDFRSHKAKSVSSIEDAAVFMQSYTHRTRFLEQLKLEKVPALRRTKTKHSDEVATLKEIAMKKEAVLAKAPIPFKGLPVMTDAQVMHLLGGMPANTAELLEDYKAKVKSMRTYAKEVDTIGEVDTITHPTFVKAVEGALKEERDHPEMFTAYHGCAAEIHFLNTVYGVLSGMLGLPKRRVHWRFFDRSYARYRHVKSAFSDTCQSANQGNKYVNQFELLVAANAALTGNPENGGCRTLTYWKKSHSEASLDLKLVLGDVFIGLGLDPRLAIGLAASLYREYEKLYYVDDPEQTASVGSAASVSSSSIAMRRVGVLRQIFVAPEDVDESLALSGWFFDTPLSFADRTLPNRTVVSIYDGLETGANAWMRELPDALRFMTHIRAGHSIPMDANIKEYHAIAPNGFRPFNLLDFEVRLSTGKDPALVQTHYYPPSAGDTTREKTVVEEALKIVNGSLDNAEIPITLFHDFYIKHKMLRLMMCNQLEISMKSAPVSLQQFKAAVAQGNLTTMELYLSNPESKKTFEEVDIIDGKSRDFTVGDYMIMVAARQQMAFSAIFAASKKYQVFHPTHSTQSPFALTGLLLQEGLDGLLHAGWDGSLDMPFKAAIFEEDPDALVIVDSPVAKKRSFKWKTLDFSVGELLQTQEKTTKRDHDLLHHNSPFTVYAKLPDKFWEELVKKNKADCFLSSLMAKINNDYGNLPDKFLKELVKENKVNDFLPYLMNAIGVEREETITNVERLKGIFSGLDSAGIAEKVLFKNYHRAILELFRVRKIKIPDGDGVRQYTKVVTDKAAVDILGKLVKYNGRDAVLAVLKGFKYEFGVTLFLEKDAEKPYQLTPKKTFDVFNSAGLIDPTWQEFTGVLSMRDGMEEEYLKDLLEIDKGGYTFSPHYLLSLPPFVLLKNLGHPLLDSALLEASRHSDPIQDSTLFSPADKKQLRKHLYDIAAEKGELDKIKLHQTEAGEWFSQLPVSARETIVTAPSFNTRLAESLNFPVIYGSGVGLEEARRLLFPARAQAVDLIFRDPGYTPLSQTTLEWLNNLLQPYAGEAFEEFLRNPKRITIPAATMFVASNMQVPCDYSIEKLRKVTDELHSESVLVLSPAQIVATLKDSYSFQFQYTTYYQGTIRELLQARLQTVQAEVKAALDGDIATKQSLQDMLKDGASPSMPGPMKAFIAFLVAD